MPEVSKSVYSYRCDSAVAPFDDRAALFVFDGVCVLCSGGAGVLMRVKRARDINFTSMQGALGQSLYAHYGVDQDESYLLIAGGRAYTASRGYLELCKIMGGAWHVLRLFELLPERACDWAYAIIARNRYRWFGRTEYCARLTVEQLARLITGAGKS